MSSDALPSRVLSTSDSSLNELIRRVNNGEPSATDRLAELAFNRLYLTAQKIVGFRNGTPTLGATALVSEGFARMFKSNLLEKIKDTHHFYSLFSKIMRQILVDYERSKLTIKRGGHSNRIELDILLTYVANQQSTVQDLSDAISDLEDQQPRAADIVQMKFFGFMTTIEICQATSLSQSTIENELRFAIAFIKRQLM